MTRQARNYLDRFLTPSGLGMILALALTAINLYASTQLFPIVRSLDQLSQRVTTLEQKVDSQGLVIIPKGELDAKFENINQQLLDIKQVLITR